MVRASALLVIAFAGAAACGEEAAPPQEHFADGQRLRAQYVEFEGGAKLFRGWFDPVLGERCRFDGLIGPSGLDHCLPFDSPPVATWSATNFGDPACTVPVFFFGVLPRAVIAIPANACDGEPAVHEVGRVATHYQKNSDGSCTRTPANIYRELGPRIALDTFVSARPEHAVTSDRIGTFTLVGADGSRQVIAGWDTEREERVWDSAEVGLDRWSPRGVSYSGGGVFSDASCAREIAQKFGDSAVCPVTTVIGFQGLYAAGARLDPRSLFRKDADACVPYGDARGDLHFEVAEPIAVEAFAEVRTIEQGSGRVRRRDVASPEGTAILPSGSPLFDTGIDQPCWVWTASDGVERCLPEGVDGPYFADAACTQTLIEGDDPPSLVSTTMLGPKPWMYSAWRVGRPFTGATAYQELQSGCTSFVPSGNYFFAEPRALTDFEAPTIHD